MILSHKHKFIFLRGQKTGGTAVSCGLCPHCGPDDIVSLMPSEIPLFDTNPEANGVPRNNEHNLFLIHEPPIIAKEKIGNGIWDEYFKFTIVRNPWDQCVSSYFWEKTVIPMKGQQTPKFIKILDTTSFYFYPGNELYADMYLRFESLEDDYKLLCERLDIPYKVLPKMKDKTRPKEYRDYHKFYDWFSERYPIDLVEQIRHVNQRAIKHFGYEY